VKRALTAQALAAAAETTVVALAMQGDDTAFGELVRRRQSTVRTLLLRLCREPALADDLAQQVFVRAWQSLRTLRAADAFGGWLRTLAANEWLQWLRRKRIPLESLQQFDELASRDTAALAASGGGDAVAERMDLDAALATLPPQPRLCVVLAYSEGMSHGEIAAALQLPLGTVKSHVTRSAARLRELLDAYGERHGH
jgi:RNA polymerase sigma-70 factor, ECF subfamily